MKIAILGAIYSDNLGDALLCKCAAKMVLEELPEAEIDYIDIWGLKQKNNIDSENRLRAVIKFIFCHIPGLIQFKNIIRNKQRIAELKATDWSDIKLAVFAGGQLFQSCFINELEYISAQLEQSSVPVIYNAIGYDTMNESERERISRILNSKNVIAVSTRDNAQEAKELFNCETITETYDPALTIANLLEVQKPVIKSELVGVGVLGGHKKEIIEIIKELDGRQMDWQLFCNGDADDYRLMKDIVKTLGYSADKAAKRPEGPEELLEQIWGYSGIVAFRMHASVIATALGIPRVGIEWNRKISSFYIKTDQKDFCFPPNTIAKKIVDALVKNMQNQHDNSADLNKYTMVTKTNLKKAIGEIYHD